MYNCEEVSNYGRFFWRYIVDFILVPNKVIEGLSASSNLILKRVL